MPAAEFLHAVSLLLRDGQLRDAFARDPGEVASSLGLRGGDRDTLVQLNAIELERQAGVLLRKRFQRVREILPDTVSKLGERAWPEFAAYSRIHWPKEVLSAEADAHGFCQLPRIRPLVSDLEFNRLQFGLSRRSFSLAIAWPHSKGRLRSPTLQLLIRPRSKALREFQFFLQI